MLRFEGLRTINVTHLAPINVYVMHSVTLKIAIVTNISAVMQPQFKFMSSADHYRHLIVVPVGYCYVLLACDAL